jgi:hypothetical protein
MTQSSNGAIFGWYVSKDKTFNGIFLKSGSFGYRTNFAYFDSEYVCIDLK